MESRRRAISRVASTLPNDNQVPTCGFPALRAALTGFRFIAPTPTVATHAPVATARIRACVRRNRPLARIRRLRLQYLALIMTFNHCRLPPQAEMAEFQTIAKVGEIPEGEGRAYPIDGTIVAVFNVGGEYTAINDVCPHMGASLAGGYIEGNSVTCPWHAWRFSVKDGTWLDNPRSKIANACYPVRGCRRRDSGTYEGPSTN